MRGDHVDFRGGNFYGPVTGVAQAPAPTALDSLPAKAAGFTGRDAELARLLDALDPAAPGDPQQAGDRALPGRQDRPDQQHLGMSPAPLAEERREAQEHRGKAGRQAQHGDVSWRGPPTYLVTRSAASGPGNGQTRDKYLAISIP